MSRSYKKHAIIKDHNKGMKTIASRRIRRKGLEEVPNGNAYKKLFEQYDICDFKYGYTLKEYLLSKNKHCRMFEERYLTEQEIKDAKIEWYKWFKGK